jgi:hypothetical protein
MQETAIVCGKQVGILDFARLGNFNFAAVPRRRRGGKGIRTPGLLIANETLYQLSYTPAMESKLSRSCNSSSSEKAWPVKVQIESEHAIPREPEERLAIASLIASSD